MVGLVGCGLFDTRDPKLPDTPGDRCLNLTTLDSLLENIRIHYGKVAGVSCYSSMLDTLFAFHPDGSDSSITPDAFLNWDDDIEISVTGNIARDSVDYFQVSFDGEYDTPSVESGPPYVETRYLNYHILFLRASDPDTARYEGRSDITFVRTGSGTYRILNWQDHRGDTGAKTWGRLRAEHRYGL